MTDYAFKLPDLQRYKNCSSTPTFLPIYNESHLITRNELKDLLHDLGFPKQKGTTHYPSHLFVCFGV